MRRSVTTSLASTLLAAAAGGAADADGPRAEFSVRDGWLHVRVARADGGPLPCRVRAITPAGHVWAEGDTGDDGQCDFPRPRADGCRVVVDLDGLPAPPVELTFLDGGRAVVPLVAPLAPGPCCVGRAAAGRPAGPDLTTLLTDGRSAVLLAASAATLALAGAVWRSSRPARIDPNQRRRP